MTNQDYPGDELFAEETGLNLFDDKASAAGSFPTSVIGYDRQEVDRYVREIEQQVSTLKLLARQLRREVAQTQQASGTTDLTRLGVHATSLLRSAEAQSQDLVTSAALEAERIKEEGRRVAADLRANAQAEADDIRVAGLANLRELRADQDRTAEETLKQARANAGSIVAAARREADTSLQQAQSNAASIIESAKIEASRLRQQADRDAAATRLEAHKQAEAVLEKTQSDHLEVKDRSQAMMAEARRQHEASTQHLASEAEHASQLRAEALAEAEQLKINAARESENQIATAHRQVAMMKDRLEEQYAWRKEQLEREVAALLQRKQTVIAQMNNLRSLAGEALMEFPDADPFADLEADQSSRPGYREQAMAERANAEPTMMLDQGTEPSAAPLPEFEQDDEEAEDTRINPRTVPDAQQADADPEPVSAMAVEAFDENPEEPQAGSDSQRESDEQVTESRASDAEAAEAEVPEDDVTHDEAPADDRAGVNQPDVEVDEADEEVTTVIAAANGPSSTKVMPKVEADTAAGDAGAARPGQGASGDGRQRGRGNRRGRQRR